MHIDRCTFNDKFHAKISSIIKTKLCRNIKKKEKLIEKLKAKYDSPSSPETLYFGKLKSFLNIASRSASEHCNCRSNIEFDEISCEDKVIKPFITKLIEEIEVAFDIPKHLMGFTGMDATAMPAQEGAFN